MNQKKQIGAWLRSRRELAGLFFALLLMFTFPASGWAQATAAISGTVKEPSGAPLAGAKVTVKNLETGTQRVTGTDGAGHYEVPSLAVGMHEVRVEMSGFKTEIRKGIKLNVGAEAVVNVLMQLSAAPKEEVTVSATLPVVNTTTAPVSGLVGEKEIRELPLNGRGFDQLITLNPGTENFSRYRSHNTTTSNGNAFVVNGARPGDNETLLNGVEYAGASQLQVTPGGVSQNMLGVDAIREFNLLSGTYGAEYGKHSGAQVVVVTKSGSNQVHGTAYEFLRNNVLDARNYFDQGPAPPFKQNQFGGSLGGPLIKNKLFLFGNYEGFRQRLALSNVTYEPDQCFYDYGQISDAGGTCPVTTPPATRTAAMDYAKYYWPHANETEVGLGTAKSFNHPRQSINEDFGTARLDYNLGQRDTLSGSYTIDHGMSILPMSDPLFASALRVTTHVFSLQETHVFSPSMVNSFIFGYSRASYSNDSAPFTTFPSNLDFVTGKGPGGIVVGGGVTTTSQGVITPAGPNNASGVYNHRNIFSFSDNLQITKGRHQFSFGVWLQPLLDNENIASRQLGQATFDNLSDFLNGTPSRFQVVRSARELAWRSFMGAWYAQDTIRLRSNLMLTLGVRHEFTNGWNEANDHAANFVTGTNTGTSAGISCAPPATTCLETVPHLGHSAFTENNGKWLFGPRVALAWDPYGDGSTAIHAGFGIYYSMLDALAFQLNSVPQYNTPLYDNGQYTYAVPGQQLSSVLAKVNSATTPLPCGTPGAPSRGCTKFSPEGVQNNVKIPTVEKWSLSLEQRLNDTMSLRVAYFGSFAYHQLLSIDGNSIPAQICTNLAGCQAGGVNGGGFPISSTDVSTAPYGSYYIPWNSNISRPNPYLGAGFLWYSYGKASYNALQVELSKRFSRRLQFRANYTWSKSLDMNSAPTIAQANNQPMTILNRSNLRQDWGPSALNASQQAHITVSYQLPFGRGQYWGADVHGVADKLVSGWTLQSIATFLSGFPITPRIGTNVSGNGDVRPTDRPNIVQGVPQLLRQGTQWINPSAFSVPGYGTFGNVGRGSLTGPGLAEVDLSLSKETKLNDRVTMQFRTECFNVLNHTNFGMPNLSLFTQDSSGNWIQSPTGGEITSTATDARQIQFGIKLIM